MLSFDVSFTAANEQTVTSHGFSAGFRDQFGLSCLQQETTLPCQEALTLPGLLSGVVNVQRGLRRKQQRDFCSVKVCKQSKYVNQK